LSVGLINFFRGEKSIRKRKIKYGMTLRQIRPVTREGTGGGSPP